MCMPHSNMHSFLKQKHKLIQLCKNFAALNRYAYAISIGKNSSVVVSIDFINIKIPFNFSGISYSILLTGCLESAYGGIDVLIF